MDDLISRQAAINALENTECELLSEELDELTDAIMNVPSAQQWHVITKRPMNDDEREAWTEWVQTFGWDDDGECPLVYGNLPKVDDVVLICTKQGFIHIDTYCHDDVEGGYFYEHDIEDIVAWTELPEPYREGKGTDNTDGQE